MNADKKLEKIARIYERTYKRKSGRGTITVTTHLYFNLLGAIVRLKERRKVDKTVLRTLDDVAARIDKIGNLLPLN